MIVRPKCKPVRTMITIPLERNESICQREVGRRTANSHLAPARCISLAVGLGVTGWGPAMTAAAALYHGLWNHKLLHFGVPAGHASLIILALIAGCALLSATLPAR